MPQSHFSEENSHFFLRSSEWRRKPIQRKNDPTKKPVFFTRRSGTKKGTLSEKADRAKEISNSRNKIFRSNRIYFIITFSDSITGWKSVQSALNALGGEITKVYNDTTVKLAIKPEDYEKFAETLEHERSLIVDIRESLLTDKLEKDFLEKLEHVQDKLQRVTIEVSDLSGLAYFDALNDALERYAMLNNEMMELGYKTTNFAIFSGTLSSFHIKEIADQIETVESIELLPEITLISYNDPIEQNVSLASVVSLSRDAKREDLPLVCAIDSGVNTAHAILQGNIEDTYDFTTNSQKPCSDNDGHGSMVSGIMVYGGSHPTHTQIMAKALMVKAFEDSKPIADIMQIIDKSTSYFSNKTKIFNLSFSAFTPNRSLSKMLDHLVFSRDLIIVACAGNVSFDQIKNNLENNVNYPDYLYNHPIYFPGDSHNVITVGASTSISSNFVPKNSPSPFTRIGMDDKNIKPDVLADGGNLNVTGGQSGNPFQFNTKDVGIRSASFNDPVKLSEGVGTSFSSPAVATIAGNIVSHYQTSSPYLVKALILSSSSLLKNATGNSFGWNIQGFGVPDYISAVLSSRWRVCYLLQGVFDGSDPLATHSYKFLFPANADKVTVTFVCGKPPNSGGCFRYKLIKSGSKPSSNLIPTSRSAELPIHTTGQAVYDIKRGGKGEWTIDVIPLFDKSIGIDKTLKYGCVVTVESTKNLDIHTSIKEWMRITAKRLEKEPQLKESAESAANKLVEQ